MKYKVGDKVRVRKDLVVDKVYGEDKVLINVNMKKYFGKIMTVDKIISTGKYKLKEDTSHWVWTEEMFEDVEDITILIRGNKVIAKMGNKVGIAKCSPEDEFDIFTGTRLAIDRLERKCRPYGWLKAGVKYYYPCVGMNNLYDCCMYTNALFDERIKERGIAFKTKEEAIDCAKKMLEVVK